MKMFTPNVTGPTGQIVVDLRSDSVFLGGAVAIEVRDSRMRLVARAAGQRTMSLPAGLYEVNAVLGDGNKHSALVQVVAGQNTTVALEPQVDSSAMLESVEESPVLVPPLRQPQFTKGLSTETRDALAHEEVGLVAIVEVDGAEVVRETATAKTFRCAPLLQAVPTALLDINGRRLRISLPISPAGDTPSAQCVVRIESSSAGTHAHAWIAPERTVANGLQNMLSAGHTFEAAQVADEAIQLLRSKYEDPTGAALGALILFKTGRLQRWEGWVENLARDFPWLPDAKVLLALLRFDPKTPSEPLLRLVLDASAQRLLLADYSLLLDMLRRWEAFRENADRRNAVDHLAADAPYVDWESICLSQWQATEEV